MKFWRATLDTRHFNFEAFGKMKSDAMMAMGETMRIHQEQYALQDDWAMMDEVNFQELEMNRGYRDYEPLPRT